MSKYASTIVEQARAWIGLKESNGTFKTIIDLYNSHKPLARGYIVKYIDEWCATFISALAIKCGMTDIIPTECGCEEMIKLFKAKGCWIENENRVPKMGEIIFYDWQDSGSGDNKGHSDHVGIVEKVSGSTITVIEGNYNCAVKRRTLAVNGKYIRGYGVPKYDSEIKKATEKVSATVKKTVNQLAKEVIAGKHGTGHEARKASLAKQGYNNYDAVRAEVNRILKISTVSYYPKYTGTSKAIDTVFKAIGVAEKYRGNWAKRKPIAQANGVNNYTGSAIQNLNLVNLAKKGTLKKV